MIWNKPNVSAVNNANNVSTQPQPPSFLQKKGLLGGKQGNMGYVSFCFSPTLEKSTTRNILTIRSIVSPTDNVLSPCSAKLSSSKQRHFAKWVFSLSLSHSVFLHQPSISRRVTRAILGSSWHTGESQLESRVNLVNSLRAETTLPTNQRSTSNPVT
jgi:hypothetical protein